jgi:ABC-type nitrate/sulfonate/bicarbonate transport system substrate-binding protein
MSAGKWTLVAGQVHLFHIVAPIIAQERNYFRDEGAGECEFLYSGSDAKTLEGMSEGRFQIGSSQAVSRLRSSSRGADLAIVGGWLNTPAYDFVAAKGRGIRGNYLIHRWSQPWSSGQSKQWVIFLLRPVPESRTSVSTTEKHFILAHHSSNECWPERRNHTPSLTVP